jgi:hypothetical protein
LFRLAYTHTQQQQQQKNIPKKIIIIQNLNQQKEFIEKSSRQKKTIFQIIQRHFLSFDLSMFLTVLNSAHFPYVSEKRKRHIFSPKKNKTQHTRPAVRINIEFDELLLLF